MKTLTTLSLLLLAFSAFAQFPYTLAYSSETYVEFNDGTPAVSEVWDDPFFTVPFGFDFNFFGETINSMTQLGLGSAFSSSEDYYAIQSLFIPYTSDIIDTGEISGSQESTITYKITGSAPNRVCHIQYKDCGFYDEVSGDGSANNLVSFQVRFYESSNDIAIHFGPNDIPEPELVHNGQSGPSIVFFEGLSIDTYEAEGTYVIGGPTTAPVIDESGPGPIDYYYYNTNPLEGNPADGTLYYFTSSVVSVEESLAEAPVEIFPNPVRDMLTISAPLDFLNSAYSIRDMSGKLVLEGLLAGGLQQLDLSGLEAGTYFIQGEHNKQVYTERIVKLGE